MHTSLRITLYILASGYLSNGFASPVTRCEDDQGHITFTQLGCANEQKASQIEIATPTPGKSPRSAVPKPQKKTNTPIKFAGITTAQDGCGNQIAEREKRESIIKKKIRAGMSIQDVESALGKPQKVTRRNDQTRYHYKDLKGNTQQVSFNADGCVMPTR
jgi:hypothetical protein